MSTSTVARNAIQMADRTVETASPLTYARSAGILYLLITIAAIVAHIYMPSTLIVAGDAAATVENIQSSEALFRFGGVGAELIILLSEVVLSIILYVLFKPVNKTVSLFAVVSRLMMTTIHGFNLINYFFILLLLGDSGYTAAFSTEETHSLVALFLDAHTYGFTIGIAFLTLHVFALAYLIYRSGYIPRILGVLFFFAGLGYLFDSTAILLVAGYETPDIVALPITIAEIAFPLWLLIKGVSREQWQKRALTSS